MDPLDLVFEPFGYGVVTGAAAFVAFGLAALGVALAAAVVRRLSVFLVLPGIARFLGVLFVVGAFADIAWMLIFPGRFYIEADQVVGFSPLLPFTLDEACGGHFLHGASFPLMTLLWGLFAAGTWAISFYLSRRLVREGTAA
jgi:hypothetical protein